MRILHLVSYSLFSGPVPSTLGLALAQREAGHEVWLGHDTKRGRINDFEESADPWIEACGLGMPNPMVLSAKSTPLEFAADVFRLRSFVRERGVEVVHVHLSHDHVLSTLALPRRFGVKVVRTIHSDRSLRRRYGQRLLNRRAQGWVVRCGEHEEALSDQLFGEQGGDGRRFIRQISGGIDSEHFTPASPEARRAARARLKIPMDAPVLGHVALIAGRGQEELVDALSLLSCAPGAPKPHLVFVGRGEHEEALRAQVAGSSVANRIHFSGYLQGDELKTGYAAMDAAFCAQPGNDASARAVLEAMSSGLPVLALQVGALAEAVSEATGFPITARTPSSIAEGLKRWSEDEEGARARGARAREFVVAQRSFAAEARKTLELYGECLSCGESPGA